VSMPKPLSSAQHKFYVRLRREKKVRDSERLFLAEGERAVLELFTAAPESLIALIKTNNSASLPLSTERVFIASEKQFATLSDTEHSQGIIGIFEQPHISSQTLFKTLEEKTSSVVLVLDDLQDPGNLGTMIRTAAWFNVDAVIASSGTVDFFNPKVVRATAGSLFALALYRSSLLFEDLVLLQQVGFTLYGASLNGQDFLETSFAAKTALVIGNEANGISERVRQVLNVEVKIHGNAQRVESLNAAVSAGILLSRICLHR
jgi:TrmH family RNA methyltransferase